MEAIDPKELWRQIPPEEKFGLMSKAHARATWAILITIFAAASLAIGFQEISIFWGAFIVSPLIFQLAASRSWRGLKPRLMLEYLAARSAARRYAFTCDARDLTLRLIFKGMVEEQYDKEHLSEALEAMVENTKRAEVWVALFGDAVVMMSEHKGGARAKLSHLLNEKLQIESVGEDYSSERQLILSSTEKNRGDEPKLKLTSRYPAALLVFEKQIKTLQNNMIENKSKLAIPIVSEESVDDSDDYNNFFNKFDG